MKNKKNYKKGMWIFTLIVLLMPLLSATTTTFYSNADTQIRSANPTTNYGTDTSMNVASPSYRSLVNFDFSSIPNGSIVTDAKLYLYYTFLSAVEDLTIIPLNKSWSETEATWTNATNILNWSLGGLNASDYLNSYSSTESVTAVGWDFYNVTNMINEAVNKSYTFNGLYLKGSTATQMTIATRESAQDPYLEITYTYPLPITNITNYNGSIQSSKNINFTCNASYLSINPLHNITHLQYFIYNASSFNYLTKSNLVKYNSTVLTPENYTQSSYFEYTLTSDGYYNYYCGGVSHYSDGSTYNDTQYSPYQYVFLIDSTAPIINFTYPTFSVTTSNVSQVNYSISDLSASKCWYSKNFGVTNSSPINAGVNFTDLVFPYGINNFTIYCNDSLNHVGSAFASWNYVNLLNCSESLQNSTGFPCGSSGSQVGLTRFNNNLIMIQSNLSGMINLNISLVGFPNSFLVGYSNGTKQYFISENSSWFEIPVYSGNTFISSVFYSNTRLSDDFGAIGYSELCSVNMTPYIYSFESGCSAYTGSSCDSSMFSNSYRYTLIAENYNYNNPPWAYANSSCLFKGVDSYNNIIMIQAWRVSGNGGQYCTIQNKWNWYVYEYDADYNNTNLTNPTYRDDIAYYDFPCEYSNIINSDDDTLNPESNIHPEWFIIDFSKKINILLFFLIFVVILILLWYGFLTLASILTIFAGFILLFSGINILIVSIFIVAGVFMAFLLRRSYSR